MSWTISHVAAVLPFTQVCRTWLSCSALVLGSMSPDFGYYLGAWGQQLRAHTVFGVLTVCLPLSWLLLMIGVGVRRPLVFLLTASVRTALTPIANAPLRLRLSDLCTCSVAIIFGALMHLFWDAWTHYSGAFVQYFDSLRALGFASLAHYRWLQHLSTGIGVLALLWRYRRWSAAHSLRAPVAARAQQGVRLGIYGCCLASTTVAALAYALPLANAVAPHFYWRVLLYQCAVFGTRVGVCLWLSAAILFWLCARDHRQRE
jgi:Domain of unknown function (DUF4184)